MDHTRIPVDPLRLGLRGRSGVVPDLDGEPGGMVPITPTAEDQALLADIVENVVLKRWAERCGAECAAEWNETVGKVVGMTATVD